MKTPPNSCAGCLRPWLGPPLALCTSGFVDDVNFSDNGPTERHVYSQGATGHNKNNSRESYQILLNEKDQQVLVVNCTPGAKSAIYKFLVIFGIWAS